MDRSDSRIVPVFFDKEDYTVNQRYLTDSVKNQARIFVRFSVDLVYTVNQTYLTDSVLAN